MSSLPETSACVRRRGAARARLDAPHAAAPVEPFNARAHLPRHRSCAAVLHGAATTVHGRERDWEGGRRGRRLGGREEAALHRAPASLARVSLPTAAAQSDGDGKSEF